MQTSREIVKRAIKFEGPERIPFCFTDDQTKYDDDDLVFRGIDPDPSFVETVRGLRETGAIYETLDDSFGQPKSYPIADWSGFKNYTFPDYTISTRYIILENIIRENPDKYILSMFPNFIFQTMIDLRGFENLMFDLIDEPKRLAEMKHMLTESALTVVENMAQRGVHGILAIEDLGLQDRLMIHPDIWRHMFKPDYARIIQYAHDRGMQIFMHSCGYIFEILDDLIEVGLDVIQIDQQDNMGIENLSKHYGGRICFYCPADIQTVLIKPGNFAAIEAKVKQLITAFGKYSGGFIAKTYNQPKAIKMPAENVAYMCKMFRKYGTPQNNYSRSAR